MLERLRFLLTGRVGTVRIPWKDRWHIVRNKSTLINQDWDTDYWWPENPADLEQKWKEKDEG